MLLKKYRSENTGQRNKSRALIHDACHKEETMSGKAAFVSPRTIGVGIPEDYQKMSRCIVYVRVCLWQP